ncbi:GAP1-N2 domain-containing protein [Nocardia sp. NPDC004085]
MTELEQLLYTRVPRGAAGLGLQPVAASRGLADREDVLTRAAVRLCRYTAPRGSHRDSATPVSYGWTDFEGMRLVFRRGHLGLDTTGRPGNFYAHVVAGPAAALPVHELAARFDSPFWWRGELPVGPVLPRIGLGEIPAAPLRALHPEELSDVVAAILAHDGQLPVILRKPPEVIVAAFAELAWRLPEVAEGLTLSTYETSRFVDEFDITGMAVTERSPLRAQADQPSYPATRVSHARLILSDDAGQRAVVRAAVGAMRSGDAANGEGVTLDAVLRCITVLTTGTPDHDLLLPVLRREGGLMTVLALPNGSDILVALLLDSGSPAWEALRQLDSVRANQAGEVATRLGRVIADRSTARMLGEYVHKIGRSLHRYRDICLLELLRRLPPHVLHTADLTFADRRVLLHIAGRCADTTAVIGPLLDTTVADCLRIADDAGLPVRVRATALARAFSATRKDPATTLARLRHPGDLASSFVEALPSVAPLCEAVGKLDQVLAYSVATATAQALDPRERHLLLGTVLPRLDAGRRPGFLAGALTAAPEPDPAWDVVISTVIGEYLVVRGQDGRRPAWVTEDITYLAGLGYGPRSAAWRQLLSAPHATDLGDALGAAADPALVRYRPVTVPMLLYRYRLLIRTPREVDQAIGDLTARGLAAGERDALDLLIDACLAGDAAPLAAAILRHVCSRLATGHRDFHLRLHPRARGLRARMTAIAAVVGYVEVGAILGKEIEDARVRAWLYDIYQSIAPLPGQALPERHWGWRTFR